MSRRSLLGGAAVAVASVASCAVLGPTGPTHVARGLRYRTGEPKFDDFFEDLHEAQVEVGRAAEREAEPRKELARVLGLPDDAGTSALAKRAEARAFEMVSGGTNLNISVEGMGSEDEDDVVVAVEASGKAPSEGDAKFVRVLRKSLSDEAKLAARMNALRGRIDDMRAAAVALQLDIDKTFRASLAQKNEVKANFEDADKVFSVLASRARSTKLAAEGFVDELVKATNSGEEQPKSTPPPDAGAGESTSEDDGEKPPPGPRPAPKPGPAPRPAPKPRPAPAPKPAPPPPPSDFEP